jgi:hypothetical protein
MIKKIIIVSAPQRSGNHAISSWLFGHFNKVIYRNHINGGAQQYELYEGASRTKNLGPLKKFSQDTVILGYENMAIKNLHPHFHRYFASMKPHCSPKVQVYVAKIMRNPYNLLASLLKYNSGFRMSPDKPMSLWSQIAKEHLGETAILKKFDRSVIINYDRWFESKNYRKKLSKFFDLEHSDKTLNTVLPFGMGSSFDKISYDQKAQTMEVTTRWKAMINNRRYIKFLKKHDGIVSYAKKIYGMHEPLENAIYGS